jgi:hypothetical protein
MGWKIKTFKTFQEMQNFVNKNIDKIQYNQIFLNNEYGIEYKKLLKIY